MDNQPKIRVRSAERVSRGLIITFDDGKSVLYSAALLRDAFSQAEELKETDRDDLGLRTVSEYRGRRNQPAKVPRLLVIGGAGSLEVPPGLTLVNTPDFPPEYEPQTLAGVEFLNVLRGEKELDWTFLSPSYLFAPGERTGKFRLGKDELLVAADGQSRISTEDFAIALVDELEQPKHSRQRFTVGY